MILSCQEMKALEAGVFAAGATAEALMEQAGEGIARAVRQFFPAAGTALVYFGKGHNGGDALVAARHLMGAGWNVQLRPAFLENELAPLTSRKLSEVEVEQAFDRRGPVIILDGLLGIGAAGELRSPIREHTREINRLRDELGARVFAIDIPTGLDGDSGRADPDTVAADFTLAVGQPKLGLVADEATNFVGRLVVLPLQALQAEGGDEVATGGRLASILPRRRFDCHKTEFGRVAIVAGSTGMTGAAALAAEGALRAGAGLVTLYTLRETHRILAAMVRPEVMVQPLESYRDLLGLPRDVLAIGPGLGRAHSEDVLELLGSGAEPMVVDADALNILATRRDLLKSMPGPRLLTPHPGEMRRLFDSGDLCRAEVARSFCVQYPLTLLFKGARTLVAQSDRPLSYNSTGSPGMATGGMGDVLTGVCAALIGQGLSLYDAARLGAWLCGRAAEILISRGEQSEESLAAADLPKALGAAFARLRSDSL